MRQLDIAVHNKICERKYNEQLLKKSLKNKFHWWRATLSTYLPFTKGVQSVIFSFLREGPPPPPVLRRMSNRLCDVCRSSVDYDYCYECGAISGDRWWRS